MGPPSGSTTPKASSLDLREEGEQHEAIDLSSAYPYGIKQSAQPPPTNLHTSIKPGASDAKGPLFQHEDDIARARGALPIPTGRDEHRVNKFRIKLRLNQPFVVAGSPIVGRVETTCISSQARLGDMIVELYAYEGKLEGMERK